MDLRELGALLRAERERRGLSIEQVSDKIKITRTCLAAIEEGNEDCLPHPVYARGFIKNYAKLLDLDNDAFREDLSRIYQTEEPPLRDISVLRDVTDLDAADGASGPAPKDNRLIIVLAVAGVVAVVALAWYLYAAFFARPAGELPTAGNGPATLEPAAAPTPAPAPVTPPPPPPSAEPAKPVAPVPAAPPVAATPIPTPAVPPTPAVTPEPTPAPKTQVAETKPVAEPSPEAKPAVEPTAEDRATQEIATNGAPVPTTPAGSAKQFTVGDRGAHVVSIVARDRCWLQAGADGGTMHETMLEAGDSFTGRFSDYLLVRLGNAGAVEIQFDGKVYPLHAAKGAVKTLKFIGRTGDELPGTASGHGTGKPGQPETVPVPATPAAQAPVPAPAPADKQAPEAPAPADKPVVTDKPAASGETPAGGKSLEVFGQDGSWVILMPDNGPAKEVYVKKGQRLTVPFGDKIEIKLGNPSNVVFRYDGKETPVTTERGEARTIRFPPQ